MDVFCPGLNRCVTNFGIDVMMNALYPSINAYVAFPPLAVSRNEKSASTVNPGVQCPAVDDKPPRAESRP